LGWPGISVKIMPDMAKLGVNVDHVATLRQARLTEYPDPAVAAKLALDEGASCITVHLREDRRHINENDVVGIRAIPGCRLNLEMAASDEIIAIAMRVRPNQITLVPEKRQELTTEGGLDVAAQQFFYKELAKRFYDVGINVSLFIDPVISQIEAAADTCALAVEINTAAYTAARTEKTVIKTMREVENAVSVARALGLVVHAGHGLNYQNVSSIAAIDGIDELNIGHSIVSHSLYTGFRNAVATMIQMIERASARKKHKSLV